MENTCTLMDVSVSLTNQTQYSATRKNNMTIPKDARYYQGGCLSLFDFHGKPNNVLSVYVMATEIYETYYIIIKI